MTKVINTARQRTISALRAAMKFCPSCGETLRPLGGPASTIMTCRSHCGSVRVTGNHGNEKLSIVFEFFEE